MRSSLDAATSARGALRTVATKDRPVTIQQKVHAEMPRSGEAAQGHPGEYRGSLLTAWRMTSLLDKSQFAPAQETNSRHSVPFPSSFNVRRDSMKILVCAALLTIGAMVATVDPAAANLVCAPGSGPGAGTMCKLCSGVVANNWRDSLIVPNTWAGSTCRLYAQSVGATSWQLGCIGQNEIHWAASQAISDTGPALPNPNCGW